jgi:antirestriction protein ArdC
MEIKNIDVYQIITDHTIAQLEQGIVPWRKPWTEAGHPQNLITKTLYTGLNCWSLGSLGYAQNYFLTWKQIQDIGASVKKGEKSHLVIYWQKVEQRYDDGSGEKYKGTVELRYFKVYNIAQCDHLPEILEIPFPSGPVFKHAAYEEIVKRMPNCPKIKHGNINSAFYDIANDCVYMPKQSLFASLESYYCTLYQQLMYATGHTGRLKRQGAIKADKGVDQYNLETLTAEIGVGYLNSITGIVDKQFVNNVPCINGWLKLLERNTWILIFASNQAQRAAEYILNVPLKPKIEELQTEQEVEART